jgi:hypothetical protein
MRQEIEGEWQQLGINFMLVLVGNVHRVNFPDGSSHCLGRRKSIARFRSWYPLIKVKNTDLCLMIDETCRRRVMTETSSLVVIKLHNYAVDTFGIAEEVLLTFRERHSLTVNYVLDMEKSACFWILLRMVDDVNCRVYLSTTSITCPHILSCALDDFRSRQIFQEKSLLIVDGNPKIKLAELYSAQQTCKEYGVTLLSHHWGIRLPLQALVERKIRCVKDIWKQFPNYTMLEVEEKLNSQ